MLKVQQKILNNGFKGVPVIDSLDKECIPSMPGIYCLVVQSQILYIGKTANLKRRLSNHLRIKQIREEYGECSIQYILTTELEVETDLIRHYNPALNRSKNPYVKNTTIAIYAKTLRLLKEIHGHPDNVHTDKIDVLHNLIEQEHNKLFKNAGRKG